MLSILIPIYNESVTGLVSGLLEQAALLEMAVEIICFDDASSGAFLSENEKLYSLPKVLYRRLPQNIGRAAIRNAMAKEAKGDYLLFIDGDSKIVRRDYLQHYIHYLDGKSVLYGGRCYTKVRPKDDAYLLHWNYGRQREERNAAYRQKAPYHSFMTNNFLMPTETFCSIGFDESIRQYGHEDTLFGMELKRRAIPILHIENPLEHAGLESAAAFLDKTKKAIENLYRLDAEGHDIETRLLSARNILRQWGVEGIYYFGFRQMEKWMYKKLLSGEGGLRLFDLYKLGLLVGMG